MKSQSDDQSVVVEERGQSRRVALACFIEDLEPDELAYEDRFVIEVQRELEKLRSASGVESYLVSLTELSALVSEAEGV